ncbi:hypothetical protein ACLOJK_008460 [Asimina triloba]
MPVVGFNFVGAFGMNIPVVSRILAEFTLPLSADVLATSPPTGGISIVKNYEKAINDKNKVAGDYSRKMYDLEVKYVNAAKALDAVKLESSEWKRKYQQTSLTQRAEEELASAELATLRSRGNATEASLAFGQEQAMIFQAEALDWKKYDKAVIEAKTALEKTTRIQEHSNEHARKREKALRAEFLAVMTEKVKEEAIKKKQIEIKALEGCMTSSRLELKLSSYLARQTLAFEKEVEGDVRRGICRAACEKEVQLNRRAPARRRCREIWRDAGLVRGNPLEASSSKAGLTRCDGR